MANILGLGGSIHDYAACLLENEKIIAIEDERLTRVRYAFGSANPCQVSLNYCLKYSSLTIQEIDTLIINDDLKSIINATNFPNQEIINHHLTHAYSTFFTSPFEESAILIIDGAGSKKFINEDNEERETTTYAYGNKNSVKTIKKIYGDLTGYNPVTKSQTVMSNSLGEFYRVIAETLQLGWLVGPGKVMGLSSYGAYQQDDRFVNEIMDYVTLLSEGQFTVKINGKDGLIDKLFLLRQKYHKKEDSFKIDAAIAYSGQIVFEKILSHLLDYLWTKTRSHNLCLAGGAALNSIANGKIARISSFKNVHVFFSPGDSGTAVGAAIYGYVNEKIKIQTSHSIRLNLAPFLGRTYSIEESEKALKKYGLTYTIPDNLQMQVAVLLSQGNVIAWYQGGSEFGPRALGNRSILADPCNPGMRDHINLHIKQREWFRPLAPVILDFAMSDYFESPTFSPWMQFVWPIKSNFKAILPSITHIDGSARVQTITKKDNPLFYSLIENFYKLTNIPILLNTSLNIKGQPIVETPEEAIQAFLESDIDSLVINHFLVMKNRNISTIKF